MTRRPRVIGLRAYFLDVGNPDLHGGGLTFSTLVFLRCAQKPSVIVTAWTGMLCSLAWGELIRFSTPDLSRGPAAF